MAWTNLPWCLHFSRGTDLLSAGEWPLQGAKNWWVPAAHFAYGAVVDLFRLCGDLHKVMQYRVWHRGTHLCTQRFDWCHKGFFTLSSLSWSSLEVIFWMNAWPSWCFVFLSIKKQVQLIQDELPLILIWRLMFALTLWGQCYELTEKGMCATCFCIYSLLWCLHDHEIWRAKRPAHPQQSTHGFCTQNVAVFQQSHGPFPKRIIFASFWILVPSNGHFGFLPWLFHIIGMMQPFFGSKKASCK